MMDLYAKRLRTGSPPVTLFEHLRDTELAAVRIFDLSKRWGRAFCRFFKLDTQEVQECFLCTLRVAGLFHDLGKANVQFLAQMKGEYLGSQTLRHEHLSALILHYEPIRRWLKSSPRLDVEVVTAAVLSHHLKASLSGDHAWCSPRNEIRKVTLYLDHADVQRMLERVREVAGLDSVPALPQEPVLFQDGSLNTPWEGALRTGRQTARAFGREILRTAQERRSLLAACKAGLIVADSVASALVREGRQIEEWIDAVAHAAPLSADKVDDDIIKPRLAAVSKPGQPAVLRDFQVRVGKQPARCLLLSSCGSGKTLAAWSWARSQIERQEIGRVIFLYPTRGTATEGFRDYVGWAPEAESALVHGAAPFEIEAMLENPPDSLVGKKVGADESEARLFALGLWPKRYFSATVDQFLAFLEHRYESLCLSPVMADAAIIIDEVHSFDRSMFKNLIAFLKEFSGPVLCMSATVPKNLCDQLEEAGLSIFPRAEDRETLSELRAAEQAKRYRVEKIEAETQALERALNGFREGLRVLWVVNTVSRAQYIAKLLDLKLGSEATLVYHSRFRLQDRKDRHSDVIRAFQQRSSAKLAVTTQVCEMSLDLDADILITELAPMTSLIQRFGRANRHLARGPSFRAQVVVYEPENALPYEDSEIQIARKFMLSLHGRELSQEELALALDQFEVPEPKVDPNARLMTSGYFAVPGEFRDIDESGTRAILDRDIDDVVDCIEHRKSYEGFTLTLPKNMTLRDFDKPAIIPRYVQVADASRYSERLGYLMESEA